MIEQAALQAATYILIVLITSFGGLSVAWIKMIVSKIKNAVLKSYLEIGTSFVETAMNATTEGFVNALKNANDFTQAKWSEAMAMTIATTKTIGSNAVLKFIEKATGDLDGWIEATTRSLLLKAQKQTQ